MNDFYHVNENHFSFLFTQDLDSTIIFLENSVFVSLCYSFIE